MHTDPSDIPATRAAARRRIVLVAGTAIAAAAGLAAADIRMGVAPADPLVVLAAAVGAAALAIGVARVLRLHRVGRDLLSSFCPPDRVVSDLTDLAGRIRSDGVLAATRGSNSPLIKAGLHLLAQDVDLRLLRSAVSTEAERAARDDRRRQRWTSACTWGGFGLGWAGVLAAIFTASQSAETPWRLGSAGGLLVLLGIAAFAAGSLCPHILAWTWRRAAAQEFARVAAIEALAAMQEGLTREQTAARLAALRPSLGRTRAARKAQRRAA